jgi:hypothetical protein
MHQPVIAADMADQHHHMMTAHRRHSGRRQSAREFPDPVGSKIEFRAHLAKHVTRRFTAAKRARAAGRPPTDDGGIVAISVGDARNLRARIGDGRNLPARGGPLVRTAPIIADDRREVDAMRVPGGGVGRSRSRKKNDRNDQKNSAIEQWFTLREEWLFLPLTAPQPPRDTLNNSPRFKSNLTFN